MKLLILNSNCFQLLFQFNDALFCFFTILTSFTYELLMFIEHLGVLEGNIINLLFEFIVIFCVNEVLLEEDELIDLLSGLLVLLPL